MNEKDFRSPNHMLTLEQKQELIKAQSLFCLLNPDEIVELAKLTKEISVEPGKVIVEQDAIIDYVYIVASGTAKITKKIITIASIQEIDIGTLSHGNAIGLDAAGHFSQVGIRTATVTAVSPMRLLIIEILDFYNFLHIKYPSLKHATEKILLMQFMENSKLFYSFTKHQIQDFSNKIRKVTIAAGSQIYKPSELADRCYFVLFGEVVVYTTASENKNIIKIAEQSAIFGEEALIENNVRNHYAEAVSDCVLFYIEYSDLDNINKNNLKNSFELNKKLQIRPVPSKEITALPQGNNKILLKNNNTTQYELTLMEYTIWQEIDGKKTLAEIYEDKKFEFDLLNIEYLYTLVKNLKNLKFLDFPEDEIKPTAKTVLDNFINKILFSLKRK